MFNRLKAMAALSAVVLLSASAAFAQGKQSVAVYMAGNEPYGAIGVHKIMGGELARVISQSGKYSAVDRTWEVRNIIDDEHAIQRSGAVSDEQIKDIGKQFGVQYLCITNISEIKTSYYLDVRLVDVVTAEVVGIVTAESWLRGGAEMIEVARKIAHELIEPEKVQAKAAREEAKRARAKKVKFCAAVGLDVLGAGLAAYGVYENLNVKKYSDDGKFSAAEKSVVKRNAAFIAGGAFLLSGISIHIFF